MRMRTVRAVPAMTILSPVLATAEPASRPATLATSIATVHCKASVAARRTGSPAVAAVVQASAVMPAPAGVAYRSARLAPAIWMTASVVWTPEQTTIIARAFRAWAVNLQR
jgi:hypothetical protein